MANANGNPPDSAGGGGVVLAGLALVWLPTVIILISFAGQGASTPQGSHGIASTSQPETTPYPVLVVSASF